MLIDSYNQPFSMNQAGIRYQNCLDSRDQTSADHVRACSSSACLAFVCVHLATQTCKRQQPSHRRAERKLKPLSRCPEQLTLVRPLRAGQIGAGYNK